MCVVPEDVGKRTKQEEELAKDRLKYGSAKEDPIKYYGKKNANILKTAKEAKKKVGFWENTKTQMLDAEHPVKKGMMDIGGGHKSVPYAKFSNRKGYGHEAEHSISHATKVIYHGLSGKENLAIKDKSGADQHFSEKGMLQHTITARIIKSIDKRIGVKFKEATGNEELEAARKSYEDGPTNITKKAFLEAKDKQIAAVKYLQERGVLTANKDGSLNLGQFQHEGEMNLASSDELLKHFEDNHPETFKKITEKADAYFDYNRALIDAKLKEGILSKNSADALKSSDYGPREFLDHMLANEIPSNSKGQSQGGTTGVKDLSKGSLDISLEHYRERIDADTYAAFRRIYENRAGRAFAEHIDEFEDKARGMGFYRAKESAEVPIGSSQLSYFENGGKQTMIVPTQFATAWQGVDPLINPDLSRRIRVWTFGNMFRGTTTGYNPTFGLTQPIIDILHSSIASDAYPDMVSSIAGITGGFFRYLPETAMRNGKWKEASNQGAFQDLKANQGDVLTRHGSKTLFNLSINGDSPIGKVLHVLNAFNETTEMSARMALYGREKYKAEQEFKKANPGKPPTDKDIDGFQARGGLAARSVADYSKGGQYSKAVGVLVPYFNAGMQATYSAGKYIKYNPYSAALKYTQVGVGLLAAALYRKGYFESDNDKKLKIQQEDKDIPFYEKVNYTHIPTSDNYRNVFGIAKRMIKITLPEPVRLMNAAVETITDHISYGTPINWNQINTGLVNSNPINIGELGTRIPFVNATASYVANTNFYTGQKINKAPANVSNWQQGQYDPNVGEVYKALGRMTKGMGEYEVSPILAQYSVQALTGNIERNDFFELPIGIAKGAMAAKEGGIQGLKDYLAKHNWLAGLDKRLYTTAPTRENYDFSGVDAKVKNNLNASYEKSNEIAAIYKQVDASGHPILKKDADLQMLKMVRESYDNNEITADQSANLIKTASLKGLASLTSKEYMDVVMYKGDVKKQAIVLYAQMKGKTDTESKAAIADMEKKGIIKGKIVLDYYKQLNKGVKSDDLIDPKEHKKAVSYSRTENKLRASDGISEKVKPDFEHGTVNINGVTRARY